MKAALVSRYGPPSVISVGETPTPRPAKNEVLIRVHATTVSRTDCGELTPYPALLARLIYGLGRPRRSIFGVDFAGVVEGAGPSVTAFKLGDRVFGICPIRKNGAHAEYVCIPQDGPIARLPDQVAFENGVVCEGAYYADSCLNRFNLKPGRKILIYGASGAIGSSALQLAKLSGAEVTAVVATQHIALAQSLGADRVVDYLKEDFSKLDERFDCVLDAVGKSSFFQCRKVMTPEAMFMAADMGSWGQNIFLLLWSAIVRNGRVAIPVARRGRAPAFVAFMADLLERGQFRAVIDRSYPLASIAEAYGYVLTGQKTGIVVVTP
ncbi:MAG: NAD(P)-dependent alcohol dehydrogenase [Vitreimonas sp.]